MSELACIMDSSCESHCLQGPIIALADNFIQSENKKLKRDVSLPLFSMHDMSCKVAVIDRVDMDQTATGKDWIRNQSLEGTDK